MRDSWEDEEEEEETGGRKRRPPTPPKARQRGRSRSSSNSSRCSSASRGSDISMESSPSSRGPIYRIPRPKVKKEWRKKEEERQAWHDSCNEKKELARIPEEKGQEEKGKEEEPLGKGPQNAKEEEPLAKGAPAAPAASAASAASAAPAAPAAPAASVAAPEKATTLKKGKVMVDYHWTLEVDDVIPPGNRVAMKVLLKKGYEIVICTWCFPRRKAEVLATLEKEDWFAQVSFIATQARTGAGGKAAICKETGCTTIFDDGTDILDDCEKHGIEVFQVKKKMGFNKGKDQTRPVYETLAGAVEEFLTKRKEL